MSIFFEAIRSPFKFKRDSRGGVWKSAKLKGISDLGIFDIFRRKRKKNKNPDQEVRAYFFDSDDQRQGGEIIPEVPAESFCQRKRIDKNLLPLLKPQMFEVDQFKALKTNILFRPSGKQPRSIAVTSAVPGEGKTFVAANLAISISQNIDGERTILLDCDMRLPSIHRIFGYKDVPGLSDYLLEGRPFSSLLLKPEFVDNLSILPGGTPRSDPYELLSSKKMLDMLRDIQTRYDDRYVVIDLPPPKLVAEANVVARAVDAVVVVVRYGQTSTDSVLEIIDLLGKNKVLGIVFNRFDTSMHSSVYRMYSKYIRRKES